MFRHQGPEYYGDQDEGDLDLLAEEEKAERQGRSPSCFKRPQAKGLNGSELMNVEWEAAVQQTAEILGLDDTTSIPYPMTASSSSSATIEAEPATTTATKSGKGKGKGKGKKRGNADEAETTDEVDADADAAKRSKTDDKNGDVPTSTQTQTQTQVAGGGLSHAFLSMLDPESLKHPTVPSVDEMSKVLLEVRKQAIRAEYGV